MNQITVECLKLAVLLRAGTRAPIVLSSEVEFAWRRMPGARDGHPAEIAVLSALPRGRDAETMARLAQWIPDYVQNVGPFTAASAALWPVAGLVMAELGVGVSGLNDAGASWPASISLVGDVSREGCALPHPRGPL